MNKQELRTNKQELISKYELIKNSYNFDTVATDGIISDLKRLDEPQPVKVPQFVADYIEFKKKYDFHVYGAMREIEDHYDKRVPEWFYEGNIEKFCLAWIFGYEVEEEKRYTVVVKGNIKENVLVYGELFERYFFTKSLSLDNAIYSHTRKQLEEAGFGWVFDCPGIEVREVE